MRTFSVCADTCHAFIQHTRTHRHTSTSPHMFSHTSASSHPGLSPRLTPALTPLALLSIPLIATSGLSLHTPSWAVHPPSPGHFSHTHPLSHPHLLTLTPWAVPPSHSPELSPWSVLGPIRGPLIEQGQAQPSARPAKGCVPRSLPVPDARRPPHPHTAPRPARCSPEGSVLGGGDNGGHLSGRVQRSFVMKEPQQ